MKDKEIIYEIAQDVYSPGYQLFGKVLENVDGNKTLELFSVIPGAKHPDPHKLVSVTLPPAAFANLVKLIEPHTK